MRGLRRVVILLPVAFMQARASQGAEHLALAARQFGGGLDMKFDWSVQLSGSALTVMRPGRKARIKQLSVAQIHLLTQSLGRSGFSKLRPRYGCDSCSDNPVCSISASVEEWAREVSVYQYVSKAPGQETEEGAELERFSQVWRVLKQVAGISSRDLCP